MYESRRTFIVTISYGEYNTKKQSLMVLANNIGMAEDIVLGWASDKSFINLEIESVKQNEDILVKEEE
jgi:hypothetical protein